MIILITLYFIISGIKHKTLIKNINQYLSYPILAFSCSILFSIIGLGSDNSASITNRISTVNTNDTSTNQRIRYYGHALNQIEHNPIIGAGMGSWKVKSIKYDHLNMEGYTVPYHAHNDFLEIAAELGLIGFLLYFSIFIIIGFYFLKRIIYYKIENKGVVISIILGLSLIGYLIDANLNFPHARVINQINLIFIIAGFLNFKHETI